MALAGSGRGNWACFCCVHRVAVEWGNWGLVLAELGLGFGVSAGGYISLVSVARLLSCSGAVIWWFVTIAHYNPI
jgi:hypothetical protein